MRGLTACRAIIEALVAEHRGRIANTAGDALLTEFPSAVDGLACAIAIQRAIAKQNEDFPPERRMLFRIGVHCGDVIPRDGDLFGDAVNIAARLQALAEPGGICVSATVREHVGTRVSAAFADAGLQPVKNIAEPVHVFRVLPSTGKPPSIAAAPMPSLPDKPSVAVLPFTNMSADPEQEYFADGIAEDIITALSRFPSLFVIARNSSFTYKGRAVDVKQVGRELGVRYVLEGSLRKAGNRIRVTAQLIEATTGMHVWADRYDRDLADIFAVQDEITDRGHGRDRPGDRRRRIAARDAQAARQPRRLGRLSARACGISGNSTPITPLSPSGFSSRRSSSIRPLPAAIAAWPRRSCNPPIHSCTRDLAEALRSAETLARKAVSLDGADADALTCLGRVRLTQGDYEGARSAIEQAIALNPNLAIAHGTLGGTLVFSGHPKEGLVALEHGIRLDPRHPRAGVILNQVVIGLYFARDYEGAVEAARRVLRSYPDHPLVYRWLAAALGQLGRSDEARQALERAVSLSPASFDFYVRRRVPWHREEDHLHMLDGLRKAGWNG